MIITTPIRVIDRPVAITTPTTIHIYSIKPAASNNKNTKSIFATKAYTPWSLVGSSMEIAILNSKLDNSCDSSGTLNLDDSDTVKMKLKDSDSDGFCSCGVIVITGGLVLELVSTISGVTVKNKEEV